MFNLPSSVFEKILKFNTFFHIFFSMNFGIDIIKD